MEPIKVHNRLDYILEHPEFTGCLIDEDNDKFWYKNGERHREDGPAIEFANNGYKAWCLNSWRYNSEQEYRIALRKIKLEKVLKRLDNENNTL